MTQEVEIEDTEVQSQESKLKTSLDYTRLKIVRKTKVNKKKTFVHYKDRGRQVSGKTRSLWFT